jgi:hypothetical protein
MVIVMVVVMMAIIGIERSISGGTIFIYSCSQTLKTIDFKRN